MVFLPIIIAAFGHKERAKFVIFYQASFAGDREDCRYFGKDTRSGKTREI